MTPGDRLAEYYRRLAVLPPAKTAVEALHQIRQTLEEVEDELSGIPKQSPPPPLDKPDGRMYPPLDDFTQQLPDGGLEARTRGHVIALEAGGRITIQNKKSGAVEFTKPGATS